LREGRLTFTPLAEAILALSDSPPTDE
jgi:hypothetical protein